MTPEEKELLLKDLCARLPYGVKVRIEGDWFYDEKEPYDTTLKSEVLGHLIANAYSVKPYLRPMSSMTREEYESIYKEFLFYGGSICQRSDMYTSVDVVDWLNAHYFDYRGLIERGLAIEVTEENNPYDDFSTLKF